MTNSKPAIDSASATMQPIALIATDIDGTLLDSASTIPSANIMAVRAALAQGVRLALVTARKRSSTLAIADALGVPCACIAHNGARAWDWAGRELRHLTIALADALAIAAFVDQYAIPAIVTIDEVNYYSANFPVPPGWEADDDRVAARMVDVVDRPPTRIIVAGDRGVAALAEGWGNLPETLVLHRYYSRDGALESAVLTHPRATKEDALAELIAHAGLVASQVLTLGDAEADAGMLRWAGVGVAMGNAMPEARAAADWVAPSHDEAGFAAALQRFVLGVA